jgi:hypothetical protein
VWVDEGTYWPEEVYGMASPPVQYNGHSEPSTGDLLAALLFSTLANTAGIQVEEISITHHLTPEE